MVSVKSILTRLIFFKEAIGTVLLLTAFALRPFTPDLEIRWSSTPLLLVDARALDTKGSDKKELDLFLITLRNKSKEAIGIQDIRLNGFQSVQSVRARSSAAFQNQELQAIHVEKQPDSSTYVLKGIKELPAGHSVQIQLAGSLYRMLLQERVSLVSTAKHPIVEEVGEASGLTLFLDRHFHTLSAMFIAVLVLVGARRLVKGDDRAEH